MKIKMGMIGGGAGSFIGPVHRMAALMDGKIEIVSGALSSDKNKSLESGTAIGLSPDRIYSNWHDMISSEMVLPDEKRPDFISIVTPNYLHFEPSKAALEAGFHVVCDKPLCSSSKEARELLELIQQKKLILCNTYGYSGKKS
jgi:predicted dehydrogenase